MSQLRPDLAVIARHVAPGSRVLDVGCGDGELMAVLGPRPRNLAVRVGLVTAMLAVALYSGAVVLRGAEGIRREVGGLPSRLPEGDARRVRFDELHLLSTRLMMVNLVGALALLFWEARE